MLETIRAADLFFLHFFFEYRSDPLVPLFSMLSAAGNTTSMIVIALAAVALLYVYRRNALGAGLLASMAFSVAVTQILKYAVGEGRPDTLYSVYTEPSYAFPSGHASAAAAFFGFLAFAAWTHIQRGPLRTGVVVIAVLYATSVTFSRLYLGVHYMSDVAAGVAIGVCAAWVGALVTRALK